MLSFPVRVERLSPRGEDHPPNPAGQGSRVRSLCRAVPCAFAAGDGATSVIAEDFLVGDLADSSRYLLGSRTENGCQVHAALPLGWLRCGCSMISAQRSRHSLQIETMPYLERCAAEQAACGDASGS